MKIYMNYSQCLLVLAILISPILSFGTVVSDDWDLVEAAIRFRQQTKLNTPIIGDGMNLAIGFPGHTDPGAAFLNRFSDLSEKVISVTALDNPINEDVTDIIIVNSVDHISDTSAKVAVSQISGIDSNLIVYNLTKSGSDWSVQDYFLETWEIE